MYNEELKTKFIREYTGSLNTANVAVRIFEVFKKHENVWNADLCTRSSNELQPVINEVTGLRARSKWMSMIILKEYVKWCMAMKVPGACDGMLHVEATGLDKVKHQMISSPLHLQRCLDEIYEKESEETIDCIYRCYFWMAYGGLDEENTILVSDKDVDLQQMLISYKDINIPVYREAIPAFRNATLLTGFLYKHPNYSKTIRRDRVPGNTIMRGIKTTTKIPTLRTVIAKKVVGALKSGATNVQLSYQRVFLSGLFYRVYEMERAGIPVNFSEAAIRFMEGRTYTFHGNETAQHKQNKIEKDYLEDYLRWKVAFSI